jgi:acetyl-CoA carboxylase carboxyltransferase component
MSSKQLRGDVNYAWPSSEIAVMGPSGAIEILEGKALAEIDNPEEKSKYIAVKEAEYRTKFANPYEAAKYGFIDDVIEPRNTRFRVIRALRTIATKKDPGPMKKHANIPL